VTRTMRLRHLYYSAAAAAAAVMALQLTGPVAAQAASLQPNDHRVDQTMVLHIPVGQTVSIVGGGEHTSNCTTDETNTTFTMKTDPQTVTFGFVAKNGGSCFFESSWSQFVVTATSNGKVVGRQRVEISMPDSFSDYHPYCRNEGALYMECRQTGDHELTLTELTGTGVTATGTVVQASLSLKVNPGSVVSIEANNSGDLSRCAADETDTTFTVHSYPETVPFGYTAVDTGSCAIENAYASFVVTVRNSEGTVVATRTIGIQGNNPPYRLYCSVAGQESVNLNCRVINNKLIQLAQTGGQGLFNAARRHAHS
jgi:hypothetical protein